MFRLSRLHLDESLRSQRVDKLRLQDRHSLLSQLHRQNIRMIKYHHLYAVELPDWRHLQFRLIRPRLDEFLPGLR